VRWPCSAVEEPTASAATVVVRRSSNNYLEAIPMSDDKQQPQSSPTPAQEDRSAWHVIQQGVATFKDVGVGVGGLAAGVKVGKEILVGKKDSAPPVSQDQGNPPEK
jgi:hypothetical protein